MTEPYFIIVWIMRGCDLHAARPEFWIDKIVGDDRDGFVLQRQQAFAANQTSVAWVFGIHRYRFVSEHRLWPGGRHDDSFVGRRLTFVVQKRIFDMPKLAFLL